MDVDVFILTNPKQAHAMKWFLKKNEYLKKWTLRSENTDWQIIKLDANYGNMN